MKKVTHLEEVKKLQKIAGILKESVITETWDFMDDDGQVLGKDDVSIEDLNNLVQKLQSLPFIKDVEFNGKDEISCMTEDGVIAMYYVFEDGQWMGVLEGQTQPEMDSNPCSPEEFFEAVEQVADYRSRQKK